MALELFQARRGTEKCGNVPWACPGQGLRALVGEAVPRSPDGWGPGGAGEKGTLRPMAAGLGVTVRCLPVVQTELAGQWEVGELCGEGKRKPWGEGDGAAGDGVGVGAGGPQPLHFSRFRFVNSCRLHAGGMGPAPSVACVQGGPGLSSCRYSKPGFEDPRRHRSRPAFLMGGQVSVGPALGSPNLWSLR